MLASNMGRLISPFVTIALAAILTPEDFGIVAVSNLIVSLALIFQDSGFGSALVQRSVDQEQMRSLSFWFTLFTGLLLSIIVYLLAPLIAVAMNDERLLLVLQIQCIQPLFINLSTVPMAILRKDYRFKKMAGLQVFPALCPIMIALPIALMGYGYWALVGSAIASSIIQAVVYWFVCPWRPGRLVWNGASIEFLRSGITFSGNSLLAWLIRRCDILLFGFFGGIAGVGMYSLGKNLLLSITRLLAAPFGSQALFSAYCESKDDRERLFAVAAKVVRLFSFVSVPVLVGIALTSHLVVPLIFNEKWAGLEQVIAILAISPSLFVLTVPYRFAIQAAGRPELQMIINVITLILLFLMGLYCAPRGLEMFLWGRFMVEIVLFGPQVFIISFVFDVKLKRILEPLMNAGLAGGIMAFCIGVFYWFSSFQINIWTELLLVILSGSGIYLITYGILDKRMLKQFFSISRRAIYTG